MIAIIDYGMGNIHSVQKALQLVGAKTIVTNSPKDIQAADKAVLPGVGAFDDAMQELEKQGLVPVLNEYAVNKKPLLGICLGMQLLFEKSEEAKKSRGLGLLKGSVRKFEESSGVKIPHMGWNQLKVVLGECPLLKGVEGGAYVYFCHSYYPQPLDKGISAVNTDYGIDFTSVVWRDNIYGVQFHPEKSQKAGLKMLENFVNLC
ncbi:MAG: imidazole glycerol phosphate synthase subunit HisH [Candidatus Omnitrophota bacterium]